MAKKAPVVRKTKKRGKEVVLAGTTEIYQPNRITNGRFTGFTLIQSKVLISIIKQLQDAIKKSMSGEDYTQMTLFKENDSNIRIGIPLADLTTPNHYADVLLAAEGMMDLKMKLKSPIGKDYISIASLISRIEVPKLEKGRSILYVQMDKDVASKLIDVDKNGRGQPAHYTKYLYEVALSSKNKYTYKLYWLISSWKSKGGFYITLAELRHNLGLEETEYPEYRKFKQRVLVPAQAELENKADCWFNCAVPDFEKREGRAVVGLNFKIIVPELQEHLQALADQARNMLRSHFRLQDAHMARLEHIFDKNFSKARYDQLVLKLTELRDYIRSKSGSESQVIDVPSYTTATLVKIFPE